MRLVQRFHHTKHHHILFSNPLQFFIHVLFCQTFYYTYIFFHFQTFHQCTVNNFKPTPFLFQAQLPILIIRVEGWLDRWPLLVIPTTIWAEVHLLPEIKVPITVRLVSKEDQDAVRLWPLLQGTVYESLLEVWSTLQITLSIIKSWNCCISYLFHNHMIVLQTFVWSGFDCHCAVLLGIQAVVVSIRISWGGSRPWPMWAQTISMASCLISYPGTLQIWI